MATLAITIVALLITSGLSSLIEASLFSISLSKVKQLAESKTKSSIVLLGIKENMESSIATLVFINNAANIFGSIVVGNIAGTLLDNFWLGIFSAALTLLIIIVAEIIPKTVGEIYCETVAPLFARPLKLVTTILFPLVFVMKK
jgi:CBS domain containing-hemolysin-like protein